MVCFSARVYRGIYNPFYRALIHSTPISRRERPCAVINSLFYPSCLLQIPFLYTDGRGEICVRVLLQIWLAHPPNSLVSSVYTLCHARGKVHGRKPLIAVKFKPRLNLQQHTCAAILPILVFGTVCSRTT